MKLMIAFIVMTFSLIVVAVEPYGPFPHEKTDTTKLANSTTGRYIYLGDVPKFDGKEIEITVAKMSLTARVTAHVNKSRINNYAKELFLRWKDVNDALSDSSLSVHPLIRIETLAAGKPALVQSWAKIAQQYSHHVLESTGMDIYGQKRNVKSFTSNEEREDYKKTISQAYFKYLFQTSEPAEIFLSDNQKYNELVSAENSQVLFSKHLGHIYTADSARPGYEGYITLVYPIAATTKGPFDQPKEMITDMKTAESIEARWWSNKWKDEFAGMPFLLIEYSGVAFHAPITNYVPLDVWFLNRWYVSHGCHRMDSSDLMELRTIMPTDLKKAANQIRITVLNNFDVLDWDKNGTLEAIDVMYYRIPTQAEVAQNPAKAQSSHYLVDNQMHDFYKNHTYASKYYDQATETLNKIPKYKITGKVLKTDGFHTQVPLVRFAHRPTRIIQYVEDNISHAGFDDSRGKYPPRYFQKH